jgi:phage-related tail protein
LSATPGWHLVGEQGPELLRFAGGEQVATATRTRQMIAVVQSRPGATQVHVYVTGDDSVLASAMSVVAKQEIAADAHLDAVLGYGGAA